MCAEHNGSYAWPRDAAMTPVHFTLDHPLVSSLGYSRPTVALFVVPGPKILACNHTCLLALID